MVEKLTLASKLRNSNVLSFAPFQIIDYYSYQSGSRLLRPFVTTMFSGFIHSLIEIPTWHKYCKIISRTSPAVYLQRHFRVENANVYVSCEYKTRLFYDVEVLPKRVRTRGG